LRDGRQILNFSFATFSTQAPNLLLPSPPSPTTTHSKMSETLALQRPPGVTDDHFQWMVTETQMMFDRMALCPGMLNVPKLLEMTEEGWERFADLQTEIYEQSKVQQQCAARPLYSGLASGVADDLRSLQLINIGSDPANTTYDAPNATAQEVFLMGIIKSWMGCNDPDNYNGFITLGGSGSNLFALEMGRDRFGIDGVPWVVCTDAAHYSNRTALRTLKMCNVKTVEHDDRDAMDIPDLAKKLGELPANANVVVILTCGTTMRVGNDDLT
jgi:hypothetical protein